MRRRSQPPSPSADHAWFFDIDGTLAEIAHAPAAARIDDELRREILRLRTAARGAVALVTGRSISSVDAMLPGLGLAVAGQHGLERRAGDGTVTRHPVNGNALADLREYVEELFGGRRGVVVEDKGASLAIHYRMAPQLAGFTHREVGKLAAARWPFGRVVLGKRVVELLPAGPDKGDAIAGFMAEPPFHGRVPVFVGDDVSDESGFVVVNTLGGVSIKVGPGRTAARWRLRDVSAVLAWLKTGA
jgi:trehalose 6-phosphate phosphatase